MNLVILGPQGSGKGTQAKLLAEKFNLDHFDTGKAQSQQHLRSYIYSRRHAPYIS